MGIEWQGSAAKHGVSREDALHAMLHPKVEDEQGPGKYPGEVEVLYIGTPHPQTDRLLEVIVAVNAKQRRMTVFHVMPLSDHYHTRYWSQLEES